MKTFAKIALLASAALVASLLSPNVWAQRGPGARGGGGAGARTAGFRAPGAGANVNTGPSMSRPAGGGSGVPRPGGTGTGGVRTRRRAARAAFTHRMQGSPAESRDRTRRARGAFNVPTWGRPDECSDRPVARAASNAPIPEALAAFSTNAGQPGGIQRPDPGAIQRPNGSTPGEIQRPNAGASPGIQRPGSDVRGARTSGALQDFLGGGGSSAGPGNRLPQGIQRPDAGRPGDIQRPAQALREQSSTSGRELAAAVTTSETRPILQHATATAPMLVSAAIPPTSISAT